MKIPIEVSAHHVHLSEKAFQALFGEGNLILKRCLSQPGQFVCEEKVEVVGDRGSIKNISVLGPFRDRTQVELSVTDMRKLDIDIHIRESGDLSGSSGCKIIGSKGEYKINEGVIAAKRHIHMSPKDAMVYGVEDKQVVDLKIDSQDRALVFGDVVVRVSSEYSLACHLDTDEANAAGIVKDTFGQIIK